MKAKKVEIKYSQFHYNIIAQYYIGCIVIQDHYEDSFIDDDIVNLIIYGNTFNITDDKLPIIEINNDPSKNYVLFNYGIYQFKQNRIVYNSNIDVDPNKLYVSNSPSKI